MATRKLIDGNDFVQADQYVNGGSWYVTTHISNGDKTFAVNVVQCYRDEAGFGGRQWNVSQGDLYPMNGQQYSTLKVIMEDALYFARQSFKVQQEIARMSLGR